MSKFTFTYVHKFMRVVVLFALLCCALGCRHKPAPVAGPSSANPAHKAGPVITIDTDHPHPIGYQWSYSTNDGNRVIKFQPAR